MKTRITLLFAALVCTGCPEAVPPSGDTSESAGSSEATSEPDLPAETSTETASGDGDGDGDPGDGDGDGSTAQTASLIVESNGVRIGYLLGVFDYGFIVWDDEHEFTFRVSQQTGNVARDAFHQGDAYWFYEGSACTGGRYVVSEYDASGQCNLVAPTRRHIIPDGGTLSGSVAPDSLWHTYNAPSDTPYQSIQDMKSLICSNVSGSSCLMPIAMTGALPVTFELPITVSESVVMP
jgi:hypothetical protein